MALKKKITKAEHGKLSDELKKLYKEGEYSDTFVLDTEDDDNDDDDPAELRRALLRERAERKRLAKELKKKNEGAEPDDDDDNEDDDDTDETPPAGKNKGERRAAKDAKKIDTTWNKKYTKDIGERDNTIATQRKFIEKQMIEGNADRIAGSISTSPKLIAPAIAKRLQVDFDGDEPELVILGDDGKPSGKSLDQLTKEFRDNKDYAAIIIGSKATGGGAPKGGADTKPGGGAPASDDKKTDLSKLTGKELAAALKARKEAKQGA